MSLNWAGLALAILLGAFAWRRSRTGGGYYDAGEYRITSALHARYGLAAAGFAAAFALCASIGWQWAAPYLFAAFALVAVFYLTSFMRGFSDEE